jgi:hypothetical protein
MGLYRTDLDESVRRISPFKSLVAVEANNNVGMLPAVVKRPLTGSYSSRVRVEPDEVAPPAISTRPSSSRMAL